MEQELSLGYSPCPNDTFIFNAIASGDVGVDGYAIKPQLHDVETLNTMAMHAELDVSKLSFYAWLQVKDSYRMLSSGAAMGFGCGPVLISRRPLSRADLAGCRVVLPGRWTTAHLLFRLWCPDARKRVFTTYDRIFDALASGDADCGVIIHESRFTFEAAGFRPVVDLGAWWEERTGLPIPLGCIAARHDLGESLIKGMDSAIHTSLRQAMQAPAETLPYIRQYAQEMDEPVLTAHIRTFVNDFTLTLPEQGLQAVDTLDRMARDAGAI
ncbi:1,4-dihydroxy-6-naphtoate synthase [Desulfosarcina ovata subsp. sediminis]|uniref:1,4-dihydroxy-6-naphtoate synthase n=1 Tax=Desulfosarcina ovata subsp. sediminis TaxID=885957 RepID=A0A5K7ZF67_9BACT|nr:1,4-dihydroxy-6-naphthoate synthase [Desulfosarcina ovata]BBO79561.1 1,4-dihydroxy-6-naphtoate synthase [Desulfosarcina ovata subsp. sediminis]